MLLKAITFQGLINFEWHSQNEVGNIWQYLLRHRDLNIQVWQSSVFTGHLCVVLHFLIFCYDFNSIYAAFVLRLKARCLKDHVVITASLLHHHTVFHASREEDTRCIPPQCFVLLKQITTCK